VERAWRRAEKSNINEEQITVEGTLLGVIPIGRRFEFQRDAERAGLLRSSVKATWSTSVTNSSPENAGGRF
jgi:hypothetical protein